MQRKATIAAAMAVLLMLGAATTGATARLLDAKQVQQAQPQPQLLLQQQQQPADDAAAAAPVPCDDTVHRGCATCRRAPGGGEGLVCVACGDNAYLNARGACVCDPGYGYRYSPAYCSKCPRISDVPEMPGSGSSYFCNQATALWEPRPAK